MKSFVTIKTLFLGAALASSLTGAAFAADDAATPAPAPAPAPTGQGLLGQTYVNLGYSYNDIANTSVNASTYSLAVNQGVRDGVDTLLEYSYLQGESNGLGRIDQQTLDIGARAYTNVYGMKPYAEAGLGGLWVKTPALSHQHSFLWFVGAGVELQVAPELSLTPFVRRSWANSVTNPKQWDYGVKGNYWLSERLGLTGLLARDNSRDTSYGLGLSIRY